LSVQPDNPFRLRLAHPDEGDLVLNLGNLVHEIHCAPASAEEMISAYVSMAKQALQPPKLDLEKIYPSLRHYEFLQGIPNTQEDPLIGEGPGDLVSVVLADQGDVVATLTKDMIEAEGISANAVLKAAEANFVALLRNEVFVAEARKGILSVGLEGYPWLGSGLLFVPSIMSRLMAENGWARVHVAAPSRETIEVVNADAPQALDHLRDWMCERLAEPRSQSEFVSSMSRGAEMLTTTHRLAGGRLLGLN
ncbi:MAG: hypothetical protein AAFY06_10385, partial [Pseudomonadota bacterium]